MINELFNLEGKVALITGGTHGIGFAIGKVLGQAGAKICVNDISEEKLESCKADYAEYGIDVFTLKFDVTSEADVDRGIVITSYSIHYTKLYEWKKIFSTVI